MSEGFGVIPNWLVRDTSISGAAKMVYVVLSSHAGAQGTTWLSHATIAAESGTSVSTVKRYLKDLVELGVVQVSPRVSQDGGQTSNLYRILAHTPLGQGGPPPRSQGPTPQVSVTYEEEPLKKNPRGTTSGRPAVSRSRGRAEYSPEFEAWWAVFPRKEKKQAAARAFEAALRRADLDTLMNHANRYRHDPNRQDQFTQHAATWLNSDGWLDAPLPARASGRPAGRTAYEQTMALADRLAAQAPTEIEAS